MKKVMFALVAALCAAVTTAAWSWAIVLSAPNVQAGGLVYTIVDEVLHIDGQSTGIKATFVGTCEAGGVWVLQRLVYGPRSWRWGQISRRGNFTEDPLLSDRPELHWSDARFPVC